MTNNKLEFFSYKKYENLDEWNKDFNDVFLHMPHDIVKNSFNTIAAQLNFMENDVTKISEYLKSPIKIIAPKFYEDMIGNKDSFLIYISVYLNDGKIHSAIEYNFNAVIIEIVETYFNSQCQFTNFTKQYYVESRINSSSILNIQFNLLNGIDVTGRFFEDIFSSSVSISLKTRITNAYYFLYGKDPTEEDIKILSSIV